MTALSECILAPELIADSKPFLACVAWANDVWMICKWVSAQDFSIFIAYAFSGMRWFSGRLLVIKIQRLRFQASPEALSCVLEQDSLSSA